MKSHYFIMAIILLVGCDDNDENIQEPDQTWEYLGLGNNNITEIKVEDEMLFAATRDGMFSKVQNSDDTLWQRTGLEGLEITDFVVYSANELLASTKVSDNQSEVFYKTTDGGITWNPVQSNFGGTENAQTCYALEKAPAEDEVLYARGIVNVAKSTDGGNTWESVYQSWSSAGYQADLIVVDEQQPNIVWAGGETSIFSPYLVKSVDNGETWVSQDIPSEGDNAVYSMAIHPDNSDRVLVGMEAQIISTNDGGETWEVNYSPAESSYVNDLQNSIIFDERVYAAGTDGGNALGDIILFISDDFGNNWETVKYAGRGDIQYAAQDIALHTDQDVEVVYIGTNQGMFAYEPDE